MKIKQTFLGVLASLPFAVLSSVALADSINDQMDKAFGSLINTTTPKSYDSARRGVLSGGQVFIRNQTKRANLLSATAPSFSAGCGGIDLYGGSFSYINADQMIETFQAIGANALGYGVKLAVNAACPSCEQVMTSLEKTAQFINSMNVDSCNAAQGIVNAAADFSTTSQVDVAAKTEGVANGWMSDINNAWSWATDNTNSPTKEIAQKDPDTAKKLLSGNIAWRTYKKADLSQVFDLGDDDKFLELIMTMTGTVIVSNPSSDADTDPKLTVINGHGVSLTEIITGGDDGSGTNEYKILKCDTTSEDGCLKVNSAPTQTISDKGLNERVLQAYIGSNGLIEAYGGDNEWSDEAKSVLSIPSISARLCNQKIYQAVVSGVDEQLTVQIATLCSAYVATEAAYNQVLAYIRAAKNAVTSSEIPTSLQTAKEEFLKVLDDSEQAYIKEYDSITKDKNPESLITILEALDFTDGQSTSAIGR